MKKYLVFKLLFCFLLITNFLQAQFNNNFKKITSNYVNRVESTPSGVQYKIYLNEKNGGNYWKGIVLIADGNDENDPWTGSMENANFNQLAEALSRQGYLAAIVAYRDQPPSPNFSNFNSNAEMLATDMNDVANAIINKYNQRQRMTSTTDKALARNRVVLLGFSYSCYCLLTNVAYSNTLAGMAGLMAMTGSTGQDQASKLKIPVFSIACQNDNLGGAYFGSTLVKAISNEGVRGRSGSFVDTSCNGHSIGDWSVWSSYLINWVKFWVQ